MFGVATIDEMMIVRIDFIDGTIQDSRGQDFLPSIQTRINHIHVGVGSFKLLIFNFGSFNPSESDF